MVDPGENDGNPGEEFPFTVNDFCRAYEDSGVIPVFEIWGSVAPDAVCGCPFDIPAYHRGVEVREALLRSTL
jgi:hypothetical protein